MWLWVLQNPLGANLSVLTGARSRHLSYKRSSTPEATFDLDLEHDDAYVLQEALVLGGGGVPRLRCFRVERQIDGTERAVCRFGGIIAPLDEGASSGIVTVTARGAFEVYEGRLTDDLFARDLTPAGDIAVELHELTETLDGPTGIVVGDVEVTDPVDVTYDERKRISDAMIDLSDVFDFEVVALAESDGQGFDLGRLDVWARQGVDRPEAVFGYGEGTVGNCDDATRQTLRPINRVWVTGDEGLVGFAEDGASQDRYGVWTETYSMSDVLDQSVLDARAEALLQPNWRRVVTFTPNPSLTDDDGEPITPQPWDAYWLGDTGRLSVRKGSFEYDGAPRLDGIDIDIDDEGYESAHSVTVAAEDVLV